MRRTAIFASIYIVSFSAALAAELAPYIVVNANAIPEPLIDAPPNPELGEALMLGAGCAACHQKDLNGVSQRMTDGEIRLMIVAPEIRVPDTAMPAYYKVGIYGEAAEDQVGRTRLSAEEVEALISYLKTL